MAVTPLRTAKAAEGHDGVDLDPIWRALKGVSSVLGRVACALAPAAGSFGTAGSCRRGASGNLGGIAEIVDGGIGGPAGICPAGRTLDRTGSVLVRVGDGRPVSIGKGNNLTCRSAQSTHGTRQPNIKLEDLPEDVIDRVFSKLQLNEVVRTSVLSSKWRHMWAISSKLRLDGIAICGRPRYFCNKPSYTKEFIDGVNTVLQQLRGKVVEELEVKFEFESILVDHLNNWISFAVSSLVKNLVLDLAPAEFVGVKDRGFPNLWKLDLHLFDASEMDLDDMLSGCANLEWLSFIRCIVNDELKVKRPLSRLLYLRIAYCSIKKVELHAKNLKTFVYHGVQLPIDLGEVKKLETAELYLYGITFEYVLGVLPSVLPDALITGKHWQIFPAEIFTAVTPSKLS
ncbi:unnamed protein product [Miscanthus lutarioriparius]|uniref:F-box domain-containing protein n=1 Tax=Miscanthus lutarioriparius TaxID=422564 RepID=A0A811NLN5_9POAL|nr:unnamed protein product [Miscanthus lutarioriparius]